MIFHILPQGREIEWLLDPFNKIIAFKNKMFVESGFLLTLLLGLHLSGASASDFFTSSGDIANMFQTERRLVAALARHAEAEEQRLASVRR